jgi:ABC-type branched-subunit amino acid transport system permease subunit
MYIGMSESWNIVGRAGYLSFGHVAFFGVGAYTTSLLLLRFHLSPFLTAPIGGVFAAIVAAMFGYPCFRLRGPYFTHHRFVVNPSTRGHIHEPGDLLRSNADSVLNHRLDFLADREV